MWVEWGKIEKAYGDQMVIPKKRVLIVTPCESGMAYICKRAICEIPGLEIERDRSFSDAVEGAKNCPPDLVIIETDCRDGDHGIVAAGAMREKGIPCILIICSCHPRKPAKSENLVVIDKLYEDLFSGLETAVKKLLRL